MRHSFRFDQGNRVMRRAVPALLLLALNACAQQRPDATADAADTTAGDTSAAIGEDVPHGAEAVLDRWAAAEQTIPHLSLAAFPNVPDWAARVFQANGCKVPQAFHQATPHNVVSGEFADPGQVDWVALCSRGDTAEIVIAWGGPVSCPAVLAPLAKRDHLQHIGGNSIGYSRALGIVSMDVIRRLALEFGGPAPPPGDHRGVEDIFVDKASTVHYCHEGEWHILAGRD